MEPRSQIIKHPSKVTIKTPLLIPSFSSKGFAIRKGESIIKAPLLMLTEFLTESMMVSAFDIYHKLIPNPDKYAFATEVVFIDSGGYETSSIYDFSGIIEYEGDSNKINEWNIKKLESVIRKWSKRYPAIIVNFDHGNIRKSLNMQISEASSFFQKFPKMLNTFLIKPETKKQQLVQVDNILDSIQLLEQFDIIGLTEKELGNSMLKRMRNIRKIREELDKANITKPIHIFGSLDPISSILYFLSGAEIFDGLSWLRFSYYDGMTIYTQNFSVLNDNLGIHVKDKQVKAQSLTNNIQFLGALKHKMINYITTKSFEEFKSLGYPGLCDILGKNYKIFINY